MPNYRNCKALKKQMIEMDVKQSDIAKHLHKCASYVTDRFTLKSSWMLEDIYDICDMLEIPYEEIPKYFPRLKDAKPRANLKQAG